MLNIFCHSGYLEAFFQFLGIITVFSGSSFLQRLFLHRNDFLFVTVFNRSPFTCNFFNNPFATQIGKTWKLQINYNLILFLINMPNKNTTLMASKARNHNSDESNGPYLASPRDHPEETTHHRPVSTQRSHISAFLNRLSQRQMDLKVGQSHYPDWDSYDYAAVADGILGHPGNLPRFDVAILAILCDRDDIFQYVWCREINDISHWGTYSSLNSDHHYWIRPLTMAHELRRVVILAHIHATWPRSTAVSDPGIIKFLESVPSRIWSISDSSFIIPYREVCSDCASLLNGGPVSQWTLRHLLVLFDEAQLLCRTGDENPGSSPILQLGKSLNLTLLGLAVVLHNDCLPLILQWRCPPPWLHWTLREAYDIGCLSLDRGTPATTMMLAQAGVSIPWGHTYTERQIQHGIIQITRALTDIAENRISTRLGCRERLASLPRDLWLHVLSFLFGITYEHRPSVCVQHTEAPETNILRLSSADANDVNDVAFRCIYITETHIKVILRKHSIRMLTIASAILEFTLGPDMWDHYCYSQILLAASPISGVNQRGYRSCGANGPLLFTSLFPEMITRPGITVSELIAILDNTNAKRMAGRPQIRITIRDGVLDCCAHIHLPGDPCSMIQLNICNGGVHNLPNTQLDLAPVTPQEHPFLYAKLLAQVVHSNPRPSRSKSSSSTSNSGGGVGKPPSADQAKPLARSRSTTSTSSASSLVPAGPAGGAKSTKLDTIPEDEAEDLTKSIGDVTPQPLEWNYCDELSSGHDAPRAQSYLTVVSSTATPQDYAPRFGPLSSVPLRSIQIAETNTIKRGSKGSISLRQLKLNHSFEATGLLVSGLCTSTDGRALQIPHIIELLRHVGLQVDLEPLEKYRQEGAQSLSHYERSITWKDNGAVLVRLQETVRAGPYYAKGDRVPALSVHLAPSTLGASEYSTSSRGAPRSKSYSITFQFTDYNLLSGATSVACYAIVPDNPDLFNDATLTVQTLLRLRFPKTTSNQPIAVLQKTRFRMNQRRYNMALIAVIVRDGNHTVLQDIRSAILGDHDTTFTIWDIHLMWWARTLEQAEMLFTGNTTFQKAKLLTLNLYKLPWRVGQTDSPMEVDILRSLASCIGSEEIGEHIISVTVGVQYLHATGWTIPTSYYLQHNAKYSSTFLSRELPLYLQAVRARFGSLVTGSVTGHTWETLCTGLVGTGNTLAIRTPPNTQAERHSAFLLEAHATSAGSTTLVLQGSSATPPTNALVARDPNQPTEAAVGSSQALAPLEATPTTVANPDRITVLEDRMTQILELMLTLQRTIATPAANGDPRPPLQSSQMGLLGTPQSNVES